MEAIILPMAQIDDATVDEIVTRALRLGLIACNCKTGPFRVAFFTPTRIPPGWSRIGFGIREKKCA